MEELRNQKRLNQILELRQEGLSQQKVADRLGIHVSTVQYYLSPKVRETVKRSVKNWIKNNPERMKELQRKWVKENPNWQKDYYKRHPDKQKERVRKNKERRRNMTPKEINRYRERHRTRHHERYHTDEEYKNKHLTATREWQKRTNYFMNRYHSDPEFRARVISSITKYQNRMRAEGNVKFLTRTRNTTRLGLRRFNFRKKFEKLGYSQSDILDAQKRINFLHKDYSLCLIKNLTDIPNFLKQAYK